MCKNEIANLNINCKKVEYSMILPEEVSCGDGPCSGGVGDLRESRLTPA